MNRQRTLSLALVALLVIGAGAGVVASATDDSSYNTSESELLNASRTNMPVTGTGDDAVVAYDKPDVSESTSAEFENGSLTGPLSIGSDQLLYDGLVVGSQHDSQAEFDNAQQLTNLTTTSSGDGAVELASGQQPAFNDGFEDNDISEWSGDTSEYSTQSTTVYEGSYALEYSGTASDNFLYRTATNDTYTTASQAIYIGSGNNHRPQIKIKNGGSTGPLVGFTDTGVVEYYNGSSWTQTSIDLSFDTWYELKITNIDYAANTYDITVYDASESVVGSASGLDFNADIDGASELRYLGNSNQFYVDNAQLGAKSSVDSARYVSSLHNVTNAEEAAINITAYSNVSVNATVQTDGGTVLNETELTGTENHTVILSSTSSDQLEVVLDINVTGSNPAFRLSDESILSSKQATYTTQTYELSEVQGASLATGLPNSTVTIDWQASADGSTWVTQTTTTHSSTGTHTPSFSGDYQYWRAQMTWTYDGGNGAGNLDTLTWDAATAGVYTGQNHTVVNASHAFLALTNKDATANVTIKGYDNTTGTWETAGNKKYTSSVFSSLALNGSYSKYRTEIRVTSTNSATVKLHSEGVTAGGTTVVERTSTTSGDGVTLASAVSEPRSASNSLLSQLPLDLLPEYLAADFEATIQSWFQRFFGGGTDTADVQEEATQLTSTYNENAGDYTAWVNSQTAGTDINRSAYDTIQVQMSVNGENATRYLIGLVDGDRFATTTVVNQTDRTVDQTVVLKGQAAVDSDSILSTIHERFVLEDKAISREYQTRLSARYGGQIDGTLLNASA
jgi:hypothetical protein